MYSLFAKNANIVMLRIVLRKSQGFIQPLLLVFDFMQLIFNQVYLSVSIA